VQALDDPVLRAAGGRGGGRAYEHQAGGSGTRSRSFIIITEFLIASRSFGWADHGPRIFEALSFTLGAALIGWLCDQMHRLMNSAPFLLLSNRPLAPVRAKRQRLDKKLCGLQQCNLAVAAQRLRNV